MSAPNNQSKSGQKSQIIIGLTISLVTIMLCIGTVELIGYLWENNLAKNSLGWTLVASRRLEMERHRTTDQPYYLLQPNKDYLWEDIPVHINSYGFRTDEFAVPKPDDTFRILNLGDSVAFGWEMQQEDTYGKKLEAALNEQQNGICYEVINAGVPGWNLEAERNFLLQEGLSFQPDLVLLDLTIVNDIYGKGPTMSEDYSIFQFLRDKTYGWPFLTTQLRFLLAQHSGPEAIPALNPPQNASAYYPLDEKSPVWDDIWVLISEMKQASEEKGVDFIIIAFPTAFQLNSADHPDIPQKVIKQRAEMADIDFIDLLPIYQNKCDTAPADACESYEDLLFADVWMHPNSLGHQIAADELFSALK
jgi:lysophospholipase L1-like esterase